MQRHVARAIGAVLVSAWILAAGGVARAQVTTDPKVNVTVVDAQPLRNIWFVARPVGGGYSLKNQFGDGGLTPANFGPGGGAFYFPNDLEPIEAYTIVGDYHDATGAGHVTVGFADPSLAVGKTFEQVFPGYDEQDVVRGLDSGDYTRPLLGFLPGLAYEPPTPFGPPPHGYGGPLGTPLTLVDFSDGAPVGTAIAVATPEPAAFVPAAAASIALLHRRRRDRPS